MSDPAHEWPEALSRLRLKLLQMLKDPARIQSGIAGALEELEQLDRIFRESRAARRRLRGDADDQKGRHYRIEEGKRGPVLAEYFSQNKPPFRCDRGVYEAIARSLDQARRPVPVEEIVRPARRATRADLPDYLVRQCLRFWLTRDPPIVEKLSTRYRPVAGFLAAARRAWAELPDNRAH